MIAPTEDLVWTLGGPLARLPPALGWALLAGAALAGVGWIIRSYARGLVALPRGRRAALAALRSAVWLGLMVLLAAPTKVRREYDRPLERPLAVVTDRSESMTTPDNRRRRRLDDALRRWRGLEPAARAAFGAVQTFGFADGMKKTGAVDATPAVPAGETRLFTALQEVTAAAPPGGWGAIVTLTDGLDTSGTARAAGVETVASGALGSGTPLFFVPGRNRFAGGPFFDLRECTVPTRVAAGTTFRVEATFDSFDTDPRTVPVEFAVNGVARPTAELRIEPGRRLTTWSAEVAAGEPGKIQVELRAGGERAKSEVQVGALATNRILYFQGALDWSYRFLAETLRRGGGFTLTPVLDLPRPEAELPAGALRRMPVSAAELDAFDIVILANVAATQFSAAEQKVLGNWVSAGGVLLFFTPDDDSAAGFAGSELEKLLPVVFAAGAPGKLDTLAGEAARRLARVRGGYAATVPLELAAFRWEETPRVREIFATAEKNRRTLVSPLFSDYAHVAYAKPGADVLARHPTDAAGPGGERAILLAVERYGRGQSGVLTTDALWRWKLHEPATDRGPETFWQDLFAWLIREKQGGLRFERPAREAWVGHEVTLELRGIGAAPPVVVAEREGTRVTLTDAGAADAARVYHWTPPAEGFWEITAHDAGGAEARHWLAVKPEGRRGERSGAAPDEAVMRDLALRTGGAVLESAPPTAWLERPAAGRELLDERREPRWHERWVFWALLGTYALELVLRRRWKML